MISSLHGTAAHVADDSLVIVVGGVGFSVAVTSQCTSEMTSMCTRT